MSLTLVVAPDLFGRTPVLEELANLITADRTIILDPYEKLGYFTDRPSANARFTALGGMDAYAKKIFDMLSDFPPWEGEKVLVGFSEGASALWCLGEQLEEIDLCIGYYGRHIHNYPHIQPRFPMELIFPESDPEIDVDSVMASLQGRENLELKKEKGFHGFMNPHSYFWKPELVQSHLRYINERLASLSPASQPH